MFLYCRRAHRWIGNAPKLTPLAPLADLVNTDAPPASTFVVVRRLVQPEWLIEVEAVAVVSK